MDHGTCMLGPGRNVLAVPGGCPLPLCPGMCPPCAGRYVSSPNMKVLEKMQRAFTHRLYLIERVGPDGSEARVDYRVLGATGNVYTVTLARQPRFVH